MWCLQIEVKKGDEVVESTKIKDVNFIKIDVEGYEEHVLRGLSQLPSLISFEFNALFLDPVLRALDSAIFDGASFNYTLVDPAKFELSKWTDREGIKERMQSRRDGPGLGDIFARVERQGQQH